MRKVLVSMVLSWVSTVVFAATMGEVWKPEVKFSLEGSSYVEALHWISGFSYALSYTSSVARDLGKPGVYCGPANGWIGSKELLEILNSQFEGKRITSEVASTALLLGVRRRFPCDK